jgi:L-ribulose-5-phosphate 3-epimerase
MRKLISTLLLPFAVSAPALAASDANAARETRYQVSVCDWMILKRQKLGAFKWARELGADGVEVDMGGLGNRPTFDSQLGNPAVREQFLAEARKFNLQISSIAMSGFYAQSFAERDGIERVLRDTIETMVALNVKVAFLPLGVQGDLVKRPELRPAVVERLKLAGRLAEAAGVVIGIETALDAKAEAALLDEIGSPAVGSYFNFSNALQNGRDIHAELRTLGRDRIVQIHCTNTDGHWLEHDPQVDLPAIKRTLDEMDWSGWLVVERSRDARRATDVRYNFTANVAYLKKIFQPAGTPAKP